MLKYFSLIVFLSIINSSCSIDENNRPTLQVGAGFLEANTRVISIDTFEVKLSTFKFDSINSSDTNRALIGQFVDPEMGTTTASSYMQLSNQSYEISSDAVLDSIALILGYDGYSYGDTLQVNSINVHRILDRFETDDDIFYNTSTLDFDPEPFAIRNYMPEPNDEDSLHISIESSLMDNIFEQIKDGDIENDLDLYQTLRGISLQPSSTDNSSVIGFTENTDKTYIRFFYNIPGEINDEELSFDLSLNPDNRIQNLFNNIKSDVSLSPLKLLVDQEIELRSEDNNNKVYIQAGVGYATKIQFPSIRKIRELPGEGVIISARLQLRPSEFNSSFSITDTLNVSVLDPDNVIKEEQLFNGLGVISAQLVEENVEFNELFYQSTIGTYLDRKISEEPIVEEGLVIYHTNYNRKVDRIIIDQSRQPQFETKLIVNYAIYED